MTAGLPHQVIIGYMKAAGELLWPIIFLVCAAFVVRQLPAWAAAGTEIGLKLMGNEFIFKPIVRPSDRPIERGSEGYAEGKLASIDIKEGIPADYYYLNRSSFFDQ